MTQQPGWGPPGYYGPPPTDGTAIAALVLAIVSFVVCPVVPAVIALVLCGQAERNIATNGTQGRGLVQAARITSWINIALAAFFFLIVIGLYA